MKVKYSKTYDIVVAGGGIAGVAAALAASRAGKRVALVEKTAWLGGLATSGLVIHYLALCDGRGRKIYTGIAEELFYACGRYGPMEKVERWQDPEHTDRLRSYFSPAALILAMEELLLQEGVALWYDTVVVDVRMEGSILRQITVHNKSGLGDLAAGAFIDATGDADIACHCGVPVAEGESGLSAWSVETSLAGSRKAIESQQPYDLLEYTKKNGSQRWYGVSGQMITDFLVEGRHLLRQHYNGLRMADPDDPETPFPLLIPSQAPTRKTRRIHSLTTIASDPWKTYADSVGIAANPMGAGGRQADVWEVPYGALAPEAVNGLLVAGRCIGADGKAWDILRTIPAVALTGQIAGTAAALALDAGAPPADVDRAALRQTLERAGVAGSIEAFYGTEAAGRGSRS